MISFKEFRPNNDAPIYRQIIMYIKRGCVAKTINNGDEMPSRRVLSALLGINPNTVQKAFRLLEEEGIIISSAGAKSYVTVDENKIRKIKEEILRESVSRMVKELKEMNIPLSEAVSIIGKEWNRE